MDKRDGKRNVEARAAELRASEERYRALFDSIDEGYCVIEVLFDAQDHPVDYRFLEVNPSFEKQTGLRDAVGKRMKELAPLHEAHWFEMYGHIALTGEAVRFQNHAEQLHRWYDVYAYRFGDPKNRQVGILFNDITARRDAEQHLQQRTRDLEQALAELDAFSYSVSHDLRAPLRSIDGFSQVLLEDCASQLDATGQDALKRVRAATQRMGLLIDDLLKLSRVTRAQMHAEDVNLSDLARTVADGLRRQAPGRQVDLTVAQDLTAQGDPGLLRVVLENLLGNAWKYSSRKEQAAVEFGADRRNGVPVFYVRDNGAGFDPAYAGKLFGAFQRLHSAHEFEGTGIGLATVNRIVRRHGGRVWAEGAIDRGATFYFTLAPDGIERSAP